MARTSTIGVDIGTSAVRAAEMSFGSGGPGKSDPTLTAFAEVPLPIGALQDGEVVETAVVADAIKKLWDKGKFSAKEVVIGVGNQRVIVREADLPWQPLNQLKKTLPFHAEQLLPTGLGDVVVDFVPTCERATEDSRLVSGLFIAAIREMVTSNALAVERGGLTPLMVDFTPLAVQRALSRGELGKYTVAFVDVGARISNLVISERGVPRFVRVLPQGGQDATEALASAMNIAPNDAERMKRRVGIGHQGQSESAQVSEALMAVTSTLVNAIRSTIQYYGTKGLGAPIDLIVLTGGGTKLDGFGQFLSSATRLPVQLGNPFERVKVAKGVNLESIRGNENVATVALGLAYGVAE
ncbi:type IV pilus assembly protein PilM [Timonella senegalensis]|uniref:type IV pilus assembly protein PilM n=1 Tax=Timonella senegalensis TaxID=1465825 RepID=UPI0028AA76A6|nr:type IV pilus assembly protein PilM [Timonella senegalensis]